MIPVTMIPATLYDNQVIWGRGGCYLDASSTGLHIRHKNPGFAAARRVGHLFETQGLKLQAELRQQSVKKITCFVTNLNYFLEKFNWHGIQTNPNIHMVLFGTFTKIICIIVLLAFSDILEPITKYLPDNKLMNDLMSYVGWLPWVFVAYQFGSLAFYSPDFVARYRKLCVNRGHAWDRVRHQCETFITTVLAPPIDPVVSQNKGQEYARLDQLWKTSRVASILTTSESMLSRIAYREFLDLYRRKADRYYVVSHAQNLGGGILTDFLTTLAIKKESQRCNRSFKWLRLNTLKEGLISDLSVARYFQQYSVIQDGRLPFSRDLLSVSINPWDDSEEESALHFWLSNGSEDNAFADMAVRAVEECYSLKPLLKNHIRDELLKIQRTFFESVHLPQNRPKSLFTTFLNDVRIHAFGIGPKKVGNLYAICLPKKLVETASSNCIYHSQPFGSPEDRDRPDTVVELLSKRWQTCEHSQGRLLASGLFPEKGVQIFAFNTIDANIQAEYRKKLKQLVNEIAPKLRPLKRKESKELQPS